MLERDFAPPPRSCVLPPRCCILVLCPPRSRGPLSPPSPLPLPTPTSSPAAAGPIRRGRHRGRPLPPLPPPPSPRCTPPLASRCPPHSPPTKPRSSLAAATAAAELHRCHRLLPYYTEKLKKHHKFSPVVELSPGNVVECLWLT
ncbi:Os02g0518800 [Oryza sativa Japonica Group]|uniref:Os02g0518800 protein n=1 Tax=Oryza sativa subsp. japonica TaxID=39947 RepID=Q0E0V7_ORYSJ|nr:Os02g0518800 [Oryza sativa Japonica Group]|eukprot:NP_001046967.1 Os02g0518800 [Oryza sativa Japonica Group]